MQEGIGEIPVKDREGGTVRIAKGYLQNVVKVWDSPGTQGKTGLVGRASDCQAVDRKSWPGLGVGP